MKEAEPNVPMEGGYLNAAAVGQALGGLTPATIRKLAKDGEIPAPVRITKKLVLWRRSEIESYLKGEPPVTTADSLKELRERLAGLVEELKGMRGEVKALREELGTLKARKEWPSGEAFEPTDGARILGRTGKPKEPFSVEAIEAETNALEKRIRASSPTLDPKPVKRKGYRGKKGRYTDEQRAKALELRKEGYTQKEAGEAIGAPYQTVASWEKGWKKAGLL